MPEQAYRKDHEHGYVYERIELPTIGRVAVIDDARLMGLPEYSSTMPTGVYVNKMWRCDGRRRVRPLRSFMTTPDPREPMSWLICEFTQHPADPRRCRITSRVAATPETIAAVAEAVLWWLPG